MSDPDFLSRSKDVGAQAAQRTQELLEQVAAQLSKASEQFNRDAESQARQAQDLVQDLFERGRAATERLVDTVESELRIQLEGVRGDLARLERRLNRMSTSRPADVAMKGSIPATATEGAPKKAAKKPAAKKSAKKSTAKKSAQKAAAKKSAKKAAAKKSAQKAAAKKSTAKKSAKKASSASSDAG